MPHRTRRLAQMVAGASVPTFGALYMFYQYWVPQHLSVNVEDDTMGVSGGSAAASSIPFLRAAAFLDAHGHEWEVQKSNVSNTIDLAATTKMELELLKMRVPYVVQQASDIYAAYNSDETAGDRRLFFSAVPHDDANGVITNVPALRLVAYVPNARPKRVVQHFSHQHLRRRWDKNYMAYDKAFVDAELTHPQLYAGVKEAEVVVGDRSAAKHMVEGLKGLDALQLKSFASPSASSSSAAGDGGVHPNTPLMVLPPSLRTPLALALNPSSSSAAAPSSSSLLIGARETFTPIYNAWARHCVGSATLEKVKLRPREFLYEMLISHKSVASLGGAAATSEAVAAPPRRGWGQGSAAKATSPATSLELDDVYSVAFQCFPQCLLPSSTVRLPPAPLDVGAGTALGTSGALIAAATKAGLSREALMNTRLRTAGAVLSGMPKLPFRTAPVQMHYQEFMVLPVWSSEDKVRYLEYARTSGASIRADLPLIAPPPADPATGKVPPCAGTLLIMTSCNDAQTPAAMPKWLERNVSMSLATGAYTMMADGVKSYEYTD